MKELIERLRERENWFQEALFEEPVEGIVSALTIDEIYCQEIMSELRQAADALERQQWRPVRNRSINSFTLPPSSDPANKLDSPRHT